MIGAIAGDIIGSVHEAIAWARKSKEFPLFLDGSSFTDDSVLTIAVADCLLTGADYVDKFHKYTRRYKDAGFGPDFKRWVEAKSREPYHSWGNGSAMRVSAVAYARDDVDAVLEEARRSAEVTHDHPEGIKGAEATALAVFMARTGEPKEDIREEIQSRFGYDLQRTCDEIRPDYDFDLSCQGTVPEAIVAFLDSTGYEDAVRLAISLGGDADTLACIAGGIAGAFYGVPPDIETQAMSRLARPLRKVVDEFRERFMKGSA